MLVSSENNYSLFLCLVQVGHGTNMSDNTGSSESGFDPDPEFPFPLARDPTMAEKLTPPASGSSSTPRREPPCRRDLRRSFSPRAGPDNTTGDDSQWQRQLPLGVQLTGHHLLMTSLILGLGIPMFTYSYNGQTLSSTRLDWVVRIVCTLLYVCFLPWCSLGDWG